MTTLITFHKKKLQGNTFQTLKGVFGVFIYIQSTMKHFLMFGIFLYAKHCTSHCYHKK